MTAEARSSVMRMVAPVLLLAVACTLFIAGMHELTEERIDRNRERMTLGMVVDAMPLTYDNDLLADRIAVSDAAAFGAADRVSIFRARRNGGPVGAVFMPVAAMGYNGRIDLAIGISFEGELTGVRISRHAETPGLGDQVHQSRSGWIRQFNGRSLSNTPEQDWAVRSDAGAFDQISGATITPRGVIRAVRGVLEYFQRNRDSVFK